MIVRNSVGVKRLWLIQGDDSPKVPGTAHKRDLQTRHLLGRAGDLRQGI